MTDVMARIRAAIARLDRNGALALALAAQEAGSREPLVLMLAAEQLAIDDRPIEALRLLASAVAIEREEPELWRRYAQLLAQTGDAERSLQAYEEVLDFEPDAPDLLIAAGGQALAAGRFDRARALYGDARAVDPNNVEAMIGLAAIAARCGDAETARREAARALTLRPGHPAARLALARADLLDQTPTEAIERLDALLAGARTDTDRIAILDLRADAWDRLDAPDRAFADYRARNALLDRQAAPLVAAQGERRIAQADRLIATFATPDPGWRTRSIVLPGEPRPKAHIFLLGFPRSGTTLLEKALAGHSDVVSLPEIDCLAGAGAALFETEAGLRRLATIAPSDAAACRRTYWSAVAAATNRPIEGQAIVDKLPLHSILLPLISKLFPDARVLLAMRDPRDVVFSCFRRRFQMNAAMFEFLELRRAATYYDRVMRLIEGYRSILPVAIRDVRHEAIVADFEGTIREILSFAGLDWQDAIAAFADRARTNVRTPSDLQLMQGLRSDGIGQWRRYAEPLAPMMEIIAPWARHFGYD